MSGHTPGPWMADDGGSGYWGIFQEDDSDGIAFLTEESGRRLRPAQAEANARLIAAAPDLLAKCEKIVAWLERLADAAEKGAAAEKRFLSLRDARLSDAKNYRTTAADVQTAIAKAQERPRQDAPPVRQPDK